MALAARLVVVLALIAFTVSPVAGQPQPEERVIPSDRVATFVYIRAEPRASSAELGRLQIGQSLPLAGSVPRWYEVQLPDGSTGFVTKSWTRVTHGLAARQEDELRIHFLQVGSGSCTVVECPGADAPPMIVDCGTIHQTDDDLTGVEVRSYVRDVLTQHTLPPTVVLSHGDRDHYSHIPSVLDDIQAQNIWLGGKASDYTSDGFPAWLAEQRDGGANVLDETKLPPDWHNDGEPIGASLSCGTASAFVLTVNTGAEKNTQSLVLFLEHHEFTAIFSGDAEGPTERQARENFDENVKATVLTGSHHGARTKGSNHPTWATATAPAVIVYSAGNKFSHPTCTAVERFTTVAQITEHRARCGLGGDDNYRSYRSKRAEYMTKSVGTIIVTSNGHSPLALHCTRSSECGVRIPH